jgi:hypothetical protein
MASESKEETFQEENEIEGEFVEEPAQTEEAQDEQEGEDWGTVVLATDLSGRVFKNGNTAIGGGGFWRYLFRQMGR